MANFLLIPDLLLAPTVPLPSMTLNTLPITHIFIPLTSPLDCGYPYRNKSTQPKFANRSLIACRFLAIYAQRSPLHPFTNVSILTVVNSDVIPTFVLMDIQGPNATMYPLFNNAHLA